MTRHIQLTIPKPCHQSWDKMSPVEQGRFCDSCQKKVMDFTGMSDEKLAAFFRKPGTSVCGRFRKEQLEADLAIPQKRIPWIKYFFQIALPAVLFSYKGYTQQVKGKVLVKPSTLLIEQENKSTKKNMQTQELPRRVLTGRVVDAEGQGISYVSIWRENTLQGTATDSSGYFRLTVKEDLLILLRISHIGYETRSILFDPANGDSIPAIQLQRKELIGVLGYVITVKKEPSVSFKRISRIIPAIMDTASRHFKVFPNPVSSGGSLNIELASKVKEGYYNLLITGLDGKRVFQKEIWIDAEAKVMNIELPSITAGNYIISLKSRKTGKEFGEKLMVQ